jgi:hypothetical protein
MHSKQSYEKMVYNFVFTLSKLLLVDPELPLRNPPHFVAYICKRKITDLRNAPMKQTLRQKLNIYSYWNLKAIKFESILTGKCIWK